MDVNDTGMQPFESNGNYIVCNGEIYNFEKLYEQHKIQNKTRCDCNIILPLCQKVGFLDMISNHLRAEFAIIYYDKTKNHLFVARDRYGVRPIFYGFNSKTKIIGFASEMKVLHPIMEYIEPIKPNHMFTIDLNQLSFDLTKLIKKENYYNYENLTTISTYDDINYIHERINKLLTKAVKFRLNADREIGFLLSGGFDSSIIVAIATRILGPNNITCFSIGFEGSSDVEAAKKVVKYLGIEKHHIVPFDVKKGLDSLEDTIKAIESYDITTIRASVPQYIMAKYINENTNIKVLLSGEGSDEIHGSYRYFRDAPNMVEFHSESIRLLEELYMFDNLRTDRTMAAHGLEVRIPFLDYKYVEFVAKIYPKLLMSNDKIEKKIIRDSFKNYLPDEILYRAKEAFSDAVSSKEQCWYQSIQKEAQNSIGQELKNNLFSINPPKSIEALYYRQIFNKIYPNRDNIISHYWMPKFQNEEITDPSATILKCYK
jgi:asparagine synthase (glutamine-hydrolysing)